MKPRGRAEPLVLLGAGAALLAASGIHSRNRIGHFSQEFVPAIVAREILIGRAPLRSGGWLFLGRLHDRQIARLEPQEESLRRGDR
jgi:hypothetical protein